ncbi:transporter substrate-binding domain-containing protein [Amorphus orientalis]|uniref:Branched-chain amino acid transport system substrate-binding protein n=1 Tax=Amorphus orientalis TaxID=649198 RepID=A0AAE4ASY4_9HYPH|nr:transporter substrate-binding domain-containing protein [Amorphus orientalis]MDQ0315763.1 branched-chain amino acid transport system substrate-binding protein [Amorphus orientalis]
MEEEAKSNAPWRVGVLFSQSGVTAAIERTQLNATLLAIDEINSAGGVAGRPIEAVAHDPQSNPKKFRELGERLMEDSRVRVVFGCYMSSTRKALLPVLEARDGLLFYPTLYEGFEYSSHCIYTGAAPNQNSLPLLKYLLDTYGDRFLFVGSNYVFPYESNRVMADLIASAKGNVLNEIYIPLEPKAEDFDKVIREIRKHGPDVIFSTVVGAGTPMLYRAYREAGFDPAKMPIASLTTSEAEVALMEPEDAAGHITAAPFFDSLNTSSARSFVSAFRLKYGQDAPIPAGAEAAYFQVHLFAEALRSAGSDAPDALVRALKGLEHDAPQGRVRIDSDNNHTYLWPKIGRITENRGFEVVWSPRIRVKPDPYFLSPSIDDWSHLPFEGRRA